MRPWLWLDRLLCRLRGHPGAMLVHRPDRLALKCHDCNWESPGIAIGRPARRVVRWPARGDNRRRKVA